MLEKIGYTGSKRDLTERGWRVGSFTRFVNENDSSGFPAGGKV